MRQYVSADRPNGVCSNRSNARPDAKPTIAPRSGPLAIPAAIASSSMMSPVAPSSRRSETSDVCRISASTITSDTRTAVTPSSHTRANLLQKTAV
jgi:hypothetical protein